MSQLDAELELVRVRLAALEEEKRNEMKAALEKKALPLKALEVMIDSHRSVQFIGNKFQHERYRIAQEKLSYLEPILNALKKINERLDVLEGNSR